MNNVTFKETLYCMADRLLQSYADLAFLGDMNCCPKKSNVIQDFCEIYSLCNLIDKPTCFKGKTPTLIDVILVTNRRKYSGVLNCTCPISDFHNFIGAATRRFAPVQKPRHVFYRSYKNFDNAKFATDITTAPFHVSEIFEDVEDMAWFTSKLLENLIYEHAQVKRKLSESVPYMNGE